MNILNLTIGPSRILLPQSAVKAQVNSVVISPDRLEIRFGAKSTVNAWTIQAAQAATARKLGMHPQMGIPKLDSLRQAFVTSYYTFVANALVENDHEHDPDGETLNDGLNDMGLGKDDYCSDQSLLHYALYDVDGVESSDVDNDRNIMAKVLGYKTHNAFQKDLKRFLPELSQKLGLNPIPKTDEQMIDALDKLGGKETKKKLAGNTKTTPSAPQNKPQLKSRPAIHTVLKKPSGNRK